MRALTRSVGADYDAPEKLKRQLEQRDRDVDAELRRGQPRFGTVLYPDRDGALYEGTLHVFKGFGARTRTMKLPKSVAGLAGHEIAVIKLDGLGTLRINAAGGDTADGGARVDLTVAGETVFICDGVGGWRSSAPTVADVDAIAAEAAYTVSAYRVITGAGATKTLADSDFPSLSDPRPTLVILGSSTTSVVVPASLSQPVGAFVNFLQTTSQATFSDSGGATVEFPLGTEDKSGGDGTQQVLTQTSADTWILGGRTSA